MSTSQPSTSPDPSTTVSPTPPLDPTQRSSTGKRKRSNTGAALAPSTSNPTARPAARELLTSTQKQSNHRNAETRRRQDILERLTIICDEIVPGAQGLAKSTEVAYTKAHQYLRDLVLEKKTLIERIREEGGVVSQEDLKALEALEEYEGISSSSESEGEEGDEGEEEDEDEEDENEPEGKESEGDEDEGDEDEEDDNNNGEIEEGVGRGRNGHHHNVNRDAFYAAESLNQMKKSS